MKHQHQGTYSAQGASSAEDSDEYRSFIHSIFNFSPPPRHRTLRPSQGLSHPREHASGQQSILLFAIQTPSSTPSPTPRFTPRHGELFRPTLFRGNLTPERAQTIQFIHESCSFKVLEDNHARSRKVRARSTSRPVHSSRQSFGFFTLESKHKYTALYQCCFRDM